MAAPAVLKINIISDFDRKGLDKGDQALRNLGRGAQVAATALGGALVAGGAAAISAAEKGASANARLANILGQTAGASDETVASVQKQAEELAKLTGIDDDVIKGAQGILGTFKSVAQTAGEAGGSFDRATVAAADLAAAGFGSVESNATALGKALEDPKKGLSALARSGVTFTEKEKKKIKALQESGKQLEAQGIILDAIEGQVAGTAEATADSTAKIKEGFDEAAESIGEALLPYVDQAAAAFQELSAWVQENTDTVLAVAKAAGAFVGVVVAATVAIKAYRAALTVYHAVVKIIAVVTRGWAIAQRLLNLAMKANPIGLIIGLIVLLVTAVVTAYQKNEKFREVVQKVWAAVKAAIKAVVDWFKKAWDAALSAVRGFFDSAGDFIGGVWDSVKSAVKSVADWFEDKWDSVVSTVRGIFDRIGDFISGIMDDIRSAVRTATDFAIGLVNNLIGAVNGAIDLINKVPGVNIGKIPALKTAARESRALSPATLRAAGATVLTNTSPYSATSASGAAGGGVQVNVKVDDRRLRDLIRVEVTEVNAGVARRVLQGAA